jgi:hypothetical protein
MAIVSTGQITIIDTNDARSITAALGTNNGLQQIYSKDDTTVTYTPSWFDSPYLVITPIVSVGGLTSAQSWAALTSKTFRIGSATGTVIDAGLPSTVTSTSFGNNSDGAITNNRPFYVTHPANGSTTASTLEIRGNLLSTVGVFTVFFTADFVDPTTGLTTGIAASLTLSTLKTGTNAVYITFRGGNVIEESQTSVKEVAAIAADLVRAAGVDASDLVYRWYDQNGARQIINNGTFTPLYGSKNTPFASGAPTRAIGDIGLNLPADGTANNTLVIHENAVSDIGIFRVTITDTVESKTYSAWFTIYDISDPYDVQVVSSTGDKLPNGVGSSTMSPRVFYGSTEISSYTGWSFYWYFYDKNGRRGGFIDTAKISTAAGAPITANTAGTSSQITYSGTSFAFTSGMIIKVVKANGDHRYYEVASSTTNVVTIKTPTKNTYLNFTDFPAPTLSEFVGGVLHGCTGSGDAQAATPGNGTRTTTAQNTWVLTGYDVDVKARIVCEADRPA